MVAALEKASSPARIGRPFVKGQSGNPGGRLKGSTFASALVQELERVRDGQTTRALIAAAIVDKAVAGDLDAAKWIVDRVDGKTPDRLEAAVDHQHRVADATLTAVLAYYAARRSLGSGEA